jgi:hypothetical protein
MRTGREARSDDHGLMDRLGACLLGGRMYPCYAQHWSAIRQAPDRPLPITGKSPHAAERRLEQLRAADAAPCAVRDAASATWHEAHLLRHVDEVRELMSREGKDI